MAEGFDDLHSLGGSRMPLKSAINFKDLVDGKSFKFEINEDDIVLFEDESDSDEEEGNWKKPTTKKFYEDSQYQWQPDDDSIDLDDFIADFDELEEKMETIHESGQVKKQVLKAGNSNRVKENAKLIVHYAAYAEGEAEPFDKTFGERTRPRALCLERNDIFRGLKIGLLTMSTGEIARFMIYPEFAFGKLGCPPRIPGGVRIIYTVELLRFITPGTVANIAYMSVDERAQLPFRQIVDAARKCKGEGNTKYGLRDYRGALRCYTQAILILEDYPTSNESDNNTRDEELPELCVNKAQALLKLELPAKACIACTLGLRYTDRSCRPNILIRFAEAKYMLQAYDDALKHCTEAVRLFKAENALMDKHTLLLEKIKKAIQKQKETDAFLCRKMLGLSTGTATGGESSGRKDQTNTKN